MPIINASTAKERFFKIIEETITTREPVFITSKTGTVVVISEDDYRSIQETLYLYSVPGMREKIMEGIKTPLDQCVEDSDEE